MLFFWIIVAVAVLILVGLTLSSKKGERKQPAISSWWYLLPLFMGFPGGLIGWFANHREHPKEARTLLIGGIIVTIAVILLRILVRML